VLSRLFDRSGLSVAAVPSTVASTAIVSFAVALVVVSTECLHGDRTDTDGERPRRQRPRTGHVVVCHDPAYGPETDEPLAAIGGTDPEPISRNAVLASWKRGTDRGVW